MTLTNTYNNGDTEDLVYTMVFDEPTQVWKPKMIHDREVWKTVLADGTRESFKLKEDSQREILKEHELGGDRNFVKEIEGGNREVEKVKLDGEKDVHKEIEHRNSTTVKDKVDGKKEVTRIPNN